MTGRNVVILLGSPRKDGNTAALAEKVAEGAREKGAEVETVYLHGLAIAACTACEGCHQPDSTGCVIGDDMTGLYPKLTAADVLVFASPIYWFTVSAQMKLAMDRCYALIGEQGHPFAGKRVGLAFTYGAADAVESGCVNAIRTFQDAFRFLGAEIVGVVHGSTGAAEIASNEKVMAAAADLGRRLAGD